VAKVAWPVLLSVPVPSVVEPSLKVTEPVSTPAPGATTPIVAVKVTDWPKTDVLADELRLVVVLAMRTGTVAGEDVLELKLPSPRYWAVIECVPAVKAAVLTAAVLPHKGVVAIGVVPSKNSTDPVGVPAPGATTPIVAQIDAELAIRVDRVSQDGVAGAGIRGVVSDRDPVAAVEGDDVAGAGDRTADRVVRGAGLDEYAVVPVGQGMLAAGVDADIVPGHKVVRRALAENGKSVAAVAGDDVACAGCGAPNCVAGRSVADAQAERIRRVESGGVPSVRADVVCRQPSIDGLTSGSHIRER
jgi:hypothetical protein